MEGMEGKGRVDTRSEYNNNIVELVSEVPHDTTLAVNLTQESINTGNSDGLSV